MYVDVCRLDGVREWVYGCVSESQLWRMKVCVYYSIWESMYGCMTVLEKARHDGIGESVYGFILYTMYMYLQGQTRFLYTLPSPSQLALFQTLIPMALLFRVWTGDLFFITFHSSHCTYHSPLITPHFPHLSLFPLHTYHPSLSTPITPPTPPITPPSSLLPFHTYHPSLSTYHPSLSTPITPHSPPTCITPHSPPLTDCSSDIPNVDSVQDRHLLYGLGAAQRHTCINHSNSRTARCGPAHSGPCEYMEDVPCGQQMEQTHGCPQGVPLLAAGSLSVTTAGTLYYTSHSYITHSPHHSHTHITPHHSHTPTPLTHTYTHTHTHTSYSMCAGGWSETSCRTWSNRSCDPVTMEIFCPPFSHSAILTHSVCLHWTGYCHGNNSSHSHNLFFKHGSFLELLPHSIHSFPYLYSAIHPYWQRLYVLLLHERFLEHKTKHFIDLCSVSNVCPYSHTPILTYTYTHIHLYFYTYIHPYCHTHIHVYPYSHSPHVHTAILTYTHTAIHIHSHFHTCIHPYCHTHIHAYFHTCIIISILHTNTIHKLL